MGTDEKPAQDRSDEVKLFNTVYNAAKADTPSTQVNGLLDLQRNNVLGLKYKSLSWDTVAIANIQLATNDELSNTINYLKNAKCFGLLFDGSTDVTAAKHLTQQSC